MGIRYNVNKLKYHFFFFKWLKKMTVNTHTFQLPNKYYFISLSNKTSRKKQQINLLNTLHSSVSDLLSVIALSSRGGGNAPFTGLGGGTAILNPPPVPWPLLLIQTPEVIIIFSNYLVFQIIKHFFVLYFLYYFVMENI